MGSAGCWITSDNIIDVTQTALRFQPDVVVAAELEGYLRGRNLGEIPKLIKQAAMDKGLRDEQILSAPSPTEASRTILDQIEPGDLALLLVLSEREQVLKLLEN